ncbi:MAG: hypothetical protein PWP31_1132 [Clostridia bacterium]|nr:hypothetical protein [Clostridia bacterium]
MAENKKHLSALRLGWVMWFVLLILSAYIVPYVFMGNLPKMSGPFLFWTLFALVAIISTIRVTNYWRD